MEEATVLPLVASEDLLSSEEDFKPTNVKVRIVV
jgi:hypothetical protein